jgi:hypothetical protein
MRMPEKDAAKSTQGTKDSSRRRIGNRKRPEEEAILLGALVVDGSGS